MKKIILVLPLLLLSFLSFSQTTINTSLGYATHGTGDMFGYAASFGVDKTFPKLSNRLSLGFNARFMTHSREHELLYTDRSGYEYNSNFRIVTSGSQLEIVPAFALIKTDNFLFRFHAGIIGRYEVTNSPRGYAFYRDIPEMPAFPAFIVIYNDMERNDFRRFDVGYISQFSMQFKISKRSQLGIAMLFQNDTNGSAITSIPISYYFSL